MLRRVVAILALVLVAGCSGSDSGPTGSGAPPSATDSGGPPTTIVADPRITSDGGVEVASLGLTFHIPESFAVADDPGLVFLARSVQPPAILSIAAASPEIAEHDAEAGEDVATISIDNVDAIVVTNAAVDGLPPGIVANELLVVNGARSFSLVLSTTEQDLAPLWDQLTASIAIR
jgi:hypothetical protein